MKVITQVEGKHGQSTNIPPTDSNNDTLSSCSKGQGHDYTSDLQHRVANLEVRLLEQRLSHLEQTINYGYSTGQPYRPSQWRGDPYHYSQYPHQQPYYYAGVVPDYPYTTSTPSGYQYPSSQSHTDDPTMMESYSTIQSYNSTVSNYSNEMEEVKLQPSPIIQGSQTFTESTLNGIGKQPTYIADQQSFPVHFSCRGYKTTRLKHQGKARMSREATSTPQRRTKATGRMLHQQAATHLEVPDSHQQFPSMLMMRMDYTPKQRHPQRNPTKSLQIPKILVLDAAEREDVDRELPSQSRRCQ